MLVATESDRQRRRELIERLRSDLPGRIFAAAGIALAIWFFLSPTWALVWLAAFAVNELIERRLTALLPDRERAADPVEAAFLVNLAFGGLTWSAGAWLFWVSDSIGGVVIALAVILGSLYHVACTSIVYPRAMIAAGTPLTLAFLVMPIAAFVDPRFSLETKLMFAAGFVFLTLYMVSASWESFRKDQELRSALASATAAAKSKAAFLSMMSHEIRTSLNGVMGMLQLLDADAKTPAQREQTGLALESSQHLLAILNDILDLSKAESGRMTLETLPVAPRDIAKAMTATYAPLARAKSVEWSCVVEPGVPEQIEIDPTRLRQILANHLSNAIKFTSAGRVSLEMRYTETSGEGLLDISISDTGIGMSKEQTEIIFEPFAQADESTTRRFGGTGLGLSISKHLVDLMSGSISVESNPGEGSQFRILLPAPVVLRSDSLVANENAPEQLSSAVAGLRILVAEDNPTSQRLLGAMLEANGNTIELAPDGSVAVERCMERAYDIILMDIKMPGRDGMSAAEAIRSSAGPNRTTPIIAVSANADEPDRARYRSVGINDCVGKPVVARALYEAIGKACA